MALLVPLVGEINLLGRMLNFASPDDVKLHLYTNNHTPTSSDTTANYTESSGAGYAAITLTGSSWVIAGPTPATASYPQQTFTYTGAEPTIYGYYVTNNAGTTLEWAELFTDGPYAIPSGGGSVKITPKISLQ
jgi:hypothetical protein